jgi:hypothetical protein
MDPASLIPVPDTIPAPAWFFDVLNILLFLVHILLINIVVGGTLIALFYTIKGTSKTVTPLSDVISSRLPLYLPFAITVGIAPLLFIQVLYGHFFYTSSILMASYWIAVIPLLIISYYGLYIYTHKTDQMPMFSRIVLAISALCFLYIGFVYVNNFSMMAQPNRWAGYFENRSGSILNLQDPTLLPRYLHFIISSVAVAAITMAFMWHRRSIKSSLDYSERMKVSLKVFGVATIAQATTGFWFLFALPSSVSSHLLGKDTLLTILLWAGVCLGIGAITTAFGGKLRLTMAQSLATVVVMVLVRYNVRTLYLKPYFSLSQLKISPQYGVLALFLIVLLMGVAAALYMLRISLASSRDSQKGCLTGSQAIHTEGGCR